MSMRDYPLMEKAALYIDGVMAAYINLAMAKKADDVPPEIEEIIKEGKFYALAKEYKLPHDFSDSFDLDNIGCYCSQFEGEITPLFPELGNFEDVSLSDDYIRYIPACKQPELFKAAYESPEELLEELKASLKDSLGGIMPDFPEEFNWWEHIGTIEGTYYA